MRKQILCGILYLALLLCAIPMGEVNVKAASPEMKIYALYLGGKTDMGGGDAVLVESDGEYLLMDMGYHVQAARYVIPFLKTMGIKELNVYFSHMHIDHYGGMDSSITMGLDSLAEIKGLTIKNLYLPDSSIGRKDLDYVDKYQKFVNAYSSYSNTSGTVVRLKEGSAFQVGSAFANVIGPLGTANSKPSLGGDNYQNNMSLVTMITCGKTRFLTGGDIMKEQEKLLAAKYKGTNTLKADIMKLSHHGTPQANSEEFIDLVKPRYAFAQNSGYEGMLGKDSGSQYKWRMMYSSWSNVNKYGMSYFTSNEKKDLVITVENDLIRLYRGSLSAADRLKGLVTLQGRTGLRNDTEVKYFIEEDGTLCQGVKEIGGKNYYFDYNMLRGKYSAQTNKWNPLYAVGKTYRYFNGKTGEMTTGFALINGKKFYHDEDGLRVLGSSNWKLVKIEGDFYALNQNGAIARNQVKKFSGKYRYFDKNGKMVVGWQVLNGNRYYFDSKGFRVDGKILKIGKYKYYFDEGGKMLVNTPITYKGKIYYFDKNGRMIKKKS